MSHQGLLFNCFCAGREEPLGRERAAPAAAGKPAHGSKRNREGALRGSAMPARGGLGSIPALGPRPGSGHVPRVVYKQKKLLKKCDISVDPPCPTGEGSGDGDAPVGQRTPETYNQRGRLWGAGEAAGAGGAARRPRGKRGPSVPPGGAQSRADAARLDRELPPPGFGYKR